MTDNLLRVFVLNVGQGNNVFIQAPDGGSILVDCYDRTKTEKLLNDLEINRIDLLAATHPHHDHIAGIPHIIKNYMISDMWDSGAVCALPSYIKTLELCRKKGIRPNRIKGLNFEKLFGELSVKVISPSLNLRKDLDKQVKLNNNKLPSDRSFNDYSFVLSLRFRNFNMVLGADAEMMSWAGLVNELPEELFCQVLLLPHHGSIRGSNFQLIEKMKPGHIIISYGENNRFGHPDRLTLEALKKYKKIASKKVEIWDTSKQGTIVVESNGSNRPIVKKLGEKPSEPVDLQKI